MKVTGAWLQDPATQSVLRVLNSAGHQALAVGGCVRNDLLGAPISDIDVATDAVPDQVIALADANGIRAIPTGIDHGTVTLVVKETAFEVTTFRCDVETDGRRAIVAFSDDIAEDAARRDFTMNALYADASGLVHDPIGGLPDLLARRVVFVGDAKARVREDYLRILRFFRFHAWYGDPLQGIDADGLAACAMLADGVEGLARERVGHEMLRLLAAPDPAPALASMSQSGVLARVLPGSNADLVAPLVHIEEHAGCAPDAIRRLAILGGDAAEDRLRLSKRDAAALNLLKAGLESAIPLPEFAYRNGDKSAFSLALLRGVLMNAAPSKEQMESIRYAAEARFPVKADDLMPDLSGPALGNRLGELEDRWIASGFVLTRDDLLD